MNLLKKIWKDPVWSKVFAAGFLVLFGWVFKLYTVIWNGIYKIFHFFILNYQAVLIIVLLIIIIFQFLKQRKLKLFSKKHKSDAPLDWISKLDAVNFQKYFFLFWFPINHRVQSHKMFYNESLDHIPEVRELLDRKVLYYRPLSGIEHVIEIDKDVYKHFENIYIKDLDRKNADIGMVIEKFQSFPFYMLFPKADIF